MIQFGFFDGFLVIGQFKETRQNLNLPKTQSDLGIKIVSLLNIGISLLPIE